MKNHEKINASARKQCAELSDSYVKKQFMKQLKRRFEWSEIKAGNIPQDYLQRVIEFKRKQIETRRTIKEAGKEMDKVLYKCYGTILDFFIVEIVYAEMRDEIPKDILLW